MAKWNIQGTKQGVPGGLLIVEAIKVQQPDNTNKVVYMNRLLIILCNYSGFFLSIKVLGVVFFP